MPSGRRMSAEWTTTSPSQVGLGPGGDEVEPLRLRNSDSVAAGSVPRCLRIWGAAKLPKLTPALPKFQKNVAGFNDAVDDMWATMSRTVQPLHNDGEFHCDSVNPARSSASAPLSVDTTAHRSDMTTPIVRWQVVKRRRRPVPGRRASCCPSRDGHP